MSSKAKGKVAEDEQEDAGLTALLKYIPELGSDPGPWLRDKYGDLDWSYTSRTVRKMSDAKLLSRISRCVFSIPPRDYNPSAPFVLVQTVHGAVALPHGYRLPLMFVGKYMWDLTFEALKGERKWRKERTEIFHLSRLCENLTRRAQAKVREGGMEKGWRCVMFDRTLARFYRHLPGNDPQACKEFISEHGIKEYDKDVLKYDWKRWCLKGINRTVMTEDDIMNGITDVDYQRSLRPADSAGQWLMGGTVIPFVNAEEDRDYSSTSDLTDFDIDLLSDSDSEGIKRRGKPSLSAGSRSGTSSRSRESSFEPNSKRQREPIADDQERASKRVRVENSTSTSTPAAAGDRTHYRYKHNHIYPLTRTLAAMAKRNPPSPSFHDKSMSVTAGASGSGSRHTPTTDSASAGGSSRFMGMVKPRSRTFLPYGGSGASSAPVGNDEDDDDSDSDDSEPIVVSSSRLAKSVFTQKQSNPSISTTTSQPRSQPLQATASSSQPRSQSPSKTPPERNSISNLNTIRKPSNQNTKLHHRHLPLSALNRSKPKPRQTRAAQTAGVATVNVYVPERGVGHIHGNTGKVKGKEKQKNKEKEDEEDETQPNGEKGTSTGVLKTTPISGEYLSTSKQVVGPLPPAPAPVSVPVVGTTLATGTNSRTDEESMSTSTTSTAPITAPTTATSATTSTSTSYASSPSDPSHLPAEAEKIPDQHGEQQQQLSSSSSSSLSAAVSSLLLQQDVINANVKALELLVNLVDVNVLKKQLLLPQEKSSDLLSLTIEPSASTPGPGSSDVNMTAPEDDTSASTTLANRFQIPDQLLSIDEQRLLASKFQDFEGRFLDVKEELIGIVGRLQILETEAKDREEEDRRRALDEEKKMEQEWTRLRDEKKRQEEEAERRRREEEDGTKASAREMKDEMVECRPACGVDMGIQASLSDDDVEMRDLETTSSKAGILEGQRSYGVIAIQTEDLPKKEDRRTRRSSYVPGVVEVVDIGVQVGTEEKEEIQVVQPKVDVEVQTAIPFQAEAESEPEEGTAKNEPSPTPMSRSVGTASTSSTLMETYGASSTSGSDTDTDMINITAATATSPGNNPNEIIDPRTAAMTSNLSLLVDNLVSAKMMSVMDNMVKSRTAVVNLTSTTAKAAVEKDLSPLSTISTDQDLDLLTSPIQMEEGDTGFHLISTLLSELKALKDESRAKAQREKEEMEAMRQLHSAEVDALRRRLSYLESQNRYFDGMISGGGIKQRERSPSVHSHYHRPSRSRHGDRERLFDSTSTSVHNGHVHTPTRARRSPVSTEGVDHANGAKTNPTTTPTPSEHSFSFRDRAEDVPLPIKSQRKHHISFPRPQVG